MVGGHVHSTGHCPRLTDEETPLKSFSQSGARMSAVFTTAGGTYRVTVVERASSWRGAHELRRTSESIECKYVRRELRQLKRGDLHAYLAATSETIGCRWTMAAKNTARNSACVNGCRDGCKDGKFNMIISIHPDSPLCLLMSCQC